MSTRRTSERVDPPASRRPAANRLRALAQRARSTPYVTGAAAGLLAKAATMAAQFVNLWLLLQVLSKAQFGSYIFVMALISWIVVIGTGGFDRLVLYRLSRDLEAPGELTGGSLVASALIAVVGISTVLAAAMAGLARFIGENPSLPGVGLWLAMLAPFVVLTCLGKVFEAWFWARGQVSRSLLVPAAADVARTAGLVLALWLLPTQGGVAAAVVASALLPLIIWVASAPLGRLRHPAPIHNADLRYSLKVMLARGANEGVQQLDLLMIGLLATAAATADYAIAARIAILIGLGKVLLAPVLTPRLGRFSAAGSHSKVVLEYSQARFIGLATALAAAAVLTLLGQPLLALFGDFRASFPLLLILSAGSILSGGFGSNAAYLSITGHAGWTLVARLVLLSLLVLLHLLLIPWLGAVGAAIGMVIGLGAANILMAVIIWRLDRVPTVTIPILLIIAASCLLLFAAASGAISGGMAAAGLVLALAALLVTERTIWRPLARRMVSRFDLSSPIG